MTCRLPSSKKQNLSFNYIFFYTILLHRSLEPLVQNYCILPSLILVRVLFWCSYMAINVSVLLFLLLLIHTFSVLSLQLKKIR